MKILHRSLGALAGLLLAIGAQAHGLTVPRYRVVELPVPDSTTAGRRDGSEQITAGGFDNHEPLTQCPSVELDPATGIPSYTIFRCHNTRIYVLTPVER